MRAWIEIYVLNSAQSPCMVALFMRAWMEM